MTTEPDKHLEDALTAIAGYVAGARFVIRPDPNDTTREIVEIHRRRGVDTPDTGLEFAGQAALEAVNVLCFRHLEGMGVLPDGASTDSGFDAWPEVASAAAAVPDVSPAPPVTAPGDGEDLDTEPSEPRTKRK